MDIIGEVVKETSSMVIGSFLSTGSVNYYVVMNSS